MHSVTPILHAVNDENVAKIKNVFIQITNISIFPFNMYNYSILDAAELIVQCQFGHLSAVWIWEDQWVTQILIYLLIEMGRQMQSWKNQII